MCARKCVVCPSLNEHVITYIITQDVARDLTPPPPPPPPPPPLTMCAVDETDRQNNETGHFKPSAFGPKVFAHAHYLIHTSARAHIPRDTFVSKSAVAT